MKLRVLAFDLSGPTERTFSRLPVRVGRHPENDLQVVDARISRFHGQFDYESDALVYRDLGSQNGSLVEIGSSDVLRNVRSEKVRADDGRLTVLLAGTRFEAIVDTGQAAELPRALAPALSEAARAIEAACSLHRERAYLDSGSIRAVLDSLSDSLLMARLGLHAEEAQPAEVQDAGWVCNERARAFLEWISTTAAALHLVEQSLEMSRVREGSLVREATDAVESLLGELAPDTIEKETTDVGVQWPAVRATAVLARYRAAHRRLVERHRERSAAIFGTAFADARRWAFAEVCATRAANDANVPDPTALGSRSSATVPEEMRTTRDDDDQQPPSSER